MFELLENDTRSKDHLVDAGMEHFSQWANPLKEALVIAYNTDYKVKSKLPKKGQQ